MSLSKWLFTFESRRERKIHKTKVKETKPERTLARALKSHKIRFQTQKLIFGKPDIFIKPNLCIFVDGEHWHTKPENRIRDQEVTSRLESQGYIVLRYSDKKILSNSDQIVEQIKTRMSGSIF